MGFLGATSDFKAQNAPVQTAVTSDNFQTAFGQTQGGLDAQAKFLAALQAQGGAANQASVFAQQQALSDQLMQQSQGLGPNPAQQALMNATGANISQQAALMAGQRGAGANVGLMARQAGQQGAGIQQQAAGQASLMQAQQQIAAQQALMQQQAAMANVAGTQVNQQANALGAYNQYAQGQQGQLLNAIGNQNNAGVAMQSNINSVDSATEQNNASTVGKIIGGVIGATGQAGAAMATGGASGAASSAPAGKAHGGQITNADRPRSNAAHYLAGLMPEAQGGIINGEQLANMGMKIPGKAAVKGDSRKNDNIPIMASPGEIIVPRTKANDPDKAAAFVKSVILKNRRK